MSGFVFSTFGTLPILAKTLWNIPIYLSTIPREQTYNKTVAIHNHDFKAVCFFSHKTNYTNQMFIIKSDFVFISENYKVKELCVFSNMNMTNKFELTYSLIEKNKKEEIYCAKNINEISMKRENIEHIKKQIDELLIHNKNQCKVYALV
jgi:hypothetical protein